MKSVSLSFLGSEKARFSGIRAIRQSWRQGAAFSYLHGSRPDSGFMLVLCPGAAFTTATGQTLYVKAGQIVYLPMGAKYRVVFDNPEERPVATILVNFHLHNKENEACIFQEQPTMICRGGDEYTELFSHIADCYATADAPGYLYRFYLLISTLLAEGCQGAEDPARSIADYIRTHLTRLGTVQALAERFAMSESTLRRLFAARYDMSVGEYILHAKIKRAKRMLQIQEAQIERIAEELGFFDAAHFSKAFKKITGLSPSVYRRSR